MLEKVKRFWKKNKGVIKVAGGAAFMVGTAVVFSKIPRSNGTIKIKTTVIDTPAMEAYLKMEAESAEYLTSIGGEIIDGSWCSATKEVATRFMEEMGSKYQLSIITPNESAIWIYKE